MFRIEQGEAEQKNLMTLNSLMFQKMINDSRLTIFDFRLPKYLISDLSTNIAY